MDNTERFEQDLADRAGGEGIYQPGEEEEEPQ